MLVEKPLAVTPGEAQELVQLAKQRGCCVQVGHSERFNPVMSLMRPHIGRPVFIECHRLSSFSERGTDVDVVLDLMIHDLDLVLSLNPGRVEKICAPRNWRCCSPRSISPTPAFSSGAAAWPT